jgi:hypothetical protein
MVTLLLAVALYVLVFGIDYLFYVKQQDAYNYVSRRTISLFLIGQLTATWLFYDLFEPFLSHLPLESVMISVFAVLLFLFTYLLTRERVFVCSMSSRTLRCLTPYYVFVKGAEILFQQTIYLAIALSLTSLLGINFLTYLTYLIILLLAHIVVIIGGGQSVIKSLTFGLFSISVPIFYIFTSLEVFWPAIYLHGLMYVFYWITIADFDVEPQE